MSALYSLLVVAAVTGIIAVITTFVFRRGHKFQFSRLFSNWAIAFSTLLGTFMITIIIFKTSNNVSLIASFLVCFVSLILANAKQKSPTNSQNDQKAA